MSRFLLTDLSVSVCVSKCQKNQKCVCAHLETVSITKFVHRALTRLFLHLNVRTKPHIMLLTQACLHHTVNKSPHPLHCVVLFSGQNDVCALLGKLP